MSLNVARRLHVPNGGPTSTDWFLSMQLHYPLIIPYKGSQGECNISLLSEGDSSHLTYPVAVSSWDCGSNSRNFSTSAPSFGEVNPGVRPASEVNKQLDATQLQFASQMLLVLEAEYDKKIRDMKFHFDQRTLVLKEELITLQGAPKRALKLNGRQKNK